MRTKSAFVVACACAILLCAGVAIAQEDDLASLQAQANEMVAKVEQAANEYQQATAQADELAASVADNEGRIAAIQAQMPDQRTRTAASIKNLYLLHQSAPGILELVLSSENFNEFITTVRYIDAIHERNLTEIRSLTDLEDQLIQTQASLEAERNAAVDKRDEALIALQSVSAARADLQVQIDALIERAAKATDPSEQQQAKSIAQDVAASADKTVSELPAEVIELTQPVAAEESTPSESAQAPTTPEPADPTPPVEESPSVAKPDDGHESSPEDKPEEPAQDPAAITPEMASADSVDSWASRIDAYLEGSELAGYGAVFAQAAAEFGVDPRLSPAIACVESGKGAVCFLPHNAWGWGSASWPDWESAIRGHVSGFAKGYGSTLTLEGAQMYASNDIYDYWFSLVQSEMSRI